VPGLGTAARGYPWAVVKPPIKERGPAIVAPPPLLYLGPLLAGLALDRFLPLPRLPAALRGVGLPLLVGGIGLGAWFFASMQRARTPVDPRQPPTALVEEGPFRFTRNPAYLGFALIYAGISLLAGGRWPMVFLPGVLGAIDRGVIAREEAYLEERFGSPYSEYRSRVRRWL
jgi:protein-S-isoprenylcysteine O-methyltransferase Ste14